MDTHRGSALAGVLAVGCSLIATIGAPAVAPWFAWTTNALSDLGTSTGPERLLFNYGLLAAGILGCGFVPAVRATASGRIGQAAVLPVVAALAGVAGVGLFPAGSSLHLPAAATAYLGFIAAPLVYGLGDLFAGEMAVGLASVLDGLIHLLVWVVSVVYLGVAVGLAVPELLGAGLFNLWVLGVAARVSRYRITRTFVPR
ncbi:DUF998 domain-containing protein [Halosegnis sp.]|uniref:DUF998 domain-containing protein n=1 Tax=Halosegnis sp. TaxID=2864959 RepID=UPI0035D47202